MRTTLAHRLRHRPTLTTVAVGLAWAAAVAAEAQQQAVDTIYVNAKVITVDSKFSTAHAFAVSGDKFFAVGENAKIRKLAGPGTAVIDLAGRTVLPGFVDTHPHVVARSRQALADPSLKGLRSVAEITQRIGEAAAKAAPGAWISTSPIGEPPDFFNLPESLSEKRFPTRVDLDKVAPNNPVYIPTPAYWPNPAILNTAALNLLGVTRDTPDESRVRIIKDPTTGEPTGVIYGFIFYNAASPLFRKLQSLIPPAWSPAQLSESLGRVLQDDMAVGLTTVYEAHGNSTPAQFNVDLQKLKSAGRATGRAVSTYEVPRGASIAEIDTWMKGLTYAQGAGTGNDYFKIVGITASLDGGAAQFGMALFNKPYLDPYGQMNNGPPPNFTAEQLTDIGRLAVKYNLRLNVLAAGDRACAMAVDAFEAVNRETPIKDRHWVLEHFQHPTLEQIKKIAAMGVDVQTYASADYSKGAETYVKRFPGTDIWKTVVPMRWFLDAHVNVAGSTDGAHYDPMFQIWETVARIDGRTGHSLMTPAKKVTRQEAIQIHTINGARLVQWEDKIGSIEAGKLADFAVLDRDILTVPLEQVRDAKVVLTAVGGEIVHDPLSLATRH